MAYFTGKRCFALFFTLTLFFVHSACHKKHQDGNLLVLHVAQRTDIQSWDPVVANDRTTFTSLSQIYETLYQYAYLSQSYKIVPLLAADYPKYSADRKTVTIPIQRGVFFQNDPAFKDSHGKGRELNAEDFIYALKRVALPALQSPGWWLLDGKIAGMHEFQKKLTQAKRSEIPKIFSENVSGLKALDHYTLQIQLTRPYPQLLHTLAMSFTTPVPHELVDTDADEQGIIQKNAIGTGPFRLVKWSPGSSLTLDRNPTYHPEFYPVEATEDFRKKGLLNDAGKPLPFIDRIQTDILEEHESTWLQFNQGNYDLIELQRDDLQEALSSNLSLNPEIAKKGIRLFSDPGTVFFSITLNMKDRLLGKNKYLRQALSSAINRDQWIELVTHSTGKKQTVSPPPGLPDRPDFSKMKYDFDLNRAKDLLKRAGYPEGNGLPTLSFDMRGSSALERQLGEFFKKQFSAIGVSLNLIYNTFPAFLDKVRKGNIQIAYGGWALDYPDIENVYLLLYGPNQSPGPNEANFNYSEMNLLYDRLSQLEPGPARAVVAKKIEEIVQEEVPWIFGYYYTVYYLNQPWIQNFRGSDAIKNTYKYLRIHRDMKNRYMQAH